MSKTKSPTKRTHFTTLLNLAEVQANPELMEFVKKEIDLLDKKNASKKPTKTQEENEVFKAVILDVLTKSGEPMTIADITKADEKLNGLPSQRVSPILRKLMDAELVVRSEVKGKAMFKAL